MNSDFETDRRQRRLSNEQPLRLNWEPILKLASMLLLSVAMWYAAYLYIWVPIVEHFLPLIKAVK